MKIYYILILVLMLGLSSCESYLDTDSPSTFDSEYLFSSTDDALKVLYSVYAIFPRDGFTSRMSCVWLQNTDVEAMALTSNLKDGTRRDIWALDPLSTWSEIKSRWDECYLAIDRANQCIEGIEASELYLAGNESMKQMLGEAYCLRAYWYWMLCNYWGDVPLALKASTYGMDLNTPRVDKDSIYSIMIHNLIVHESDMQWASDGPTIERMSREFAMGMIARLSLFRAGYSMQYDGTMARKSDYKAYYDTARIYCQKLIASKEHTLNSSFSDVFNKECALSVVENSDVLYEVAFASSSGGDVGWCVGVPVSSGTGSYGSTTIQVNFTPSYYYSFDTCDLRQKATCTYNGYYVYESSSSYTEMPLGYNSIACNKWSRTRLPSAPGASSSKGTGINWPIMRYSDVLLMLAESENELNDGPTDSARWALKQVRNRAFSSTNKAAKVDAYVDSISTKEDFFNAIVNERAWEFGGECYRKFDLVRWNLYGAKIVETKTTLKEMGLSARGVGGYSYYDSYADVIYYRMVKGKAVFYNTPYQRPTEILTTADVSSSYADSPTGVYHKLSWLSSLAATDSTASTYVTYMYRGYTDETGASAVPYLLPINETTISASNGVLSNAGYGL
jgi:starch-binding outer membrane protein, SusD/RagB family